MKSRIALSTPLAAALLAAPATLLLPVRTGHAAPHHGGGGGSHHHTAAKSHPAAAASAGSWTPQPSLVDQLAPESQVGGFRMRLPNGYTLVHTEDLPSQNGTFTLDLYYGDKRSDSSVPAIGIVTSRSSQFNVTSDPGGLLDTLLTAVERHTTDGKPDLVVSRREYGHIHGVASAREYFKFTYLDASGARYKAHGFYYVMLTSDEAMMVFGLDTEPYNKDTLPLVETAALTIHQ